MARTRPSQTPRGAAAQIEAFLRSDPAAPLTAAVGFASVRGLAWLAERTAGRRVTLVIGDCRPGNFAKADAADRELVKTFLARRDVEVKNWYQKHPKSVEAHLKVWIARTKEGPRALVGSANLTAAGLFHHWEMVAEPTPSDLPRVVDEVDALVGQAWDVKPRLGQYISPSRTRRSPKEAILSRRPRFTPDPRAGPTEHRPQEAVPPKGGAGPRAAIKGCLRMLLLFIGAVALLSAAAAILMQAIIG